MKETISSNNLPLRARVEDGNLIITIGIDTLAFAFEHSEANNPYDEDFADTKQLLHIANARQFAEDVCHELNREGEDGSTPFTRFLDSMMDEAVEQGSLGIEDPEDSTAGRREPTLTREQIAAEPCKCVRCSMCSGTGRIRVDHWSGYDTEPCEDCDNGIVEPCGRCEYLADLDGE